MTFSHSHSSRNRHRRAVGVFSDRRIAEQALHNLRDSGFPMDRVSVITRDTGRAHDIAGAEVQDADDTRRIGNKADEGASLGATTGGVLGGLTGLLVGLGTLAIPGIGPIMLAGATATTLATTLAGGAIGAVAGGLVGALVGLGIPEEQAKIYNERVARGEYLVIVDGTDEEIAIAHQILQRHDVQHYGVYDAPEGTVPAYATQTTPVVSTPVHPSTAVATPVVSSSTVPVRDQGVDVARSKHMVGVFTDPRTAEQAIADLHHSGFPLQQVSLIAHDANRWQSYGGVEVRDRFEAMRYGIPAERARVYNHYLDQGNYLLIINGTEDELQTAMTYLNRHNMQGGQIYDSTLIQSMRTVDNTPGTSPASLDRTVPLDMPAPTTQHTVYTTKSTVSVSSLNAQPQPSVPVSSTPSTTARQKRAVGVFGDHRTAERALTDLRNAGFPLQQVSLIGKDRSHPGSVAGVPMNQVDPQARGNKADEGAKAGAATGAALGGLGGLLVGLGTLAIPGVGPVILSGAAATALATALSGGAIGAAAGGIVGGLVGLGIPENRAKVYQKHLDRGDYLLMVDGTETEVRHAESILKRHGIQEWDIYDGTDVSAHHTTTTRMGGVDTVVPGDRPIGTTQRVNSSPEVIIVDRRTSLE